MPRNGHKKRNTGIVVLIAFAVLALYLYNTGTVAFSVAGNTYYPFCILTSDNECTVYADSGMQGAGRVFVTVESASSSAEGISTEDIDLEKSTCEGTFTNIEFTNCNGGIVKQFIRSGTVTNIDGKLSCNISPIINNDNDVRCGDGFEAKVSRWAGTGSYKINNNAFIRFNVVKESKTEAPTEPDKTDPQETEEPTDEDEPPDVPTGTGGEITSIDYTLVIIGIISLIVIGIGYMVLKPKKKRYSYKR